MYNGKVPYTERITLGFLEFLHTVPKDYIGHKKMAVESGYTSSAE